MKAPLLAAIAALLVSPSGARAPDAGAPAAFDGTWLFDGVPDYPGLRAVQIAQYGGQATGEVFTDWYGKVPMRSLEISGDTATFQMETPSPHDAPTNWTIHRDGDAIRVTGKIWYQHVEAEGHPGPAAAVARFLLPPNPLPKLHKLPDNGLARTPPMGWSSWNHFADRIDDATIRQIADAMVSSGLRDAGYPVDATDSHGYTAVILAAYDHQPAALDFLLSAGANACVGDRHGNTALMGALFKGESAISRRLLETRCPIDQTNGAGETALGFATLFNRLDMIPLLVKHGADPDHVDGRGQSLLQIALSHDSTAAANALRKAGATR